MNRGDIVTFNIRKIRKDDGSYKYDALFVNSLDKEEDLEVIEYCVHNENVDLWLCVFQKHLQKLENTEDIVEFVTKKASLLEDHNLKYKFAQKLESLSNEIQERQEIRKLYNDAKRVDILLSLIKIESPQEDLTDELKNVLQRISCCK